MQRRGVGWLRKRAHEAATKNKARIPLRGFEYVETQQVNLPADPTIASASERETGALPNAPYMFQEDLRQYRSYNAYKLEALKARARFNADRKEGWWFKINELQAKSHYAQPNANVKTPSLEQRYVATRAIRSKVTKANKSAAPISESKIKALVDLEQLAAVDSLISVDAKTKNPDSAITGQFLEEQLAEILAHNGIFSALAKSGIDKFSPRENVAIEYAGNTQVLYGNEITPEDAQTQPKLHFSDDTGTYTTLAVSVDSGLDKPANYLHWAAVNNETIVDYLPFIPTRGTGYHRIVFLTFKNIDATKLKLQNNFNLEQRKYWTSSLPVNYQDSLVSIKFINTRWDRSVTTTFREVLQMKEPVYEFNDWPTKKRAPLTTYSQEDVSVTDVEASMPEESIYPGGGQPEEYQTSRVWSDFNQQWVYKKRQPGK